MAVLEAADRRLRDAGAASERALADAALEAGGAQLRAEGERFLDCQGHTE